MRPKRCPAPGACLFGQAPGAAAFLRKFFSKDVNFFAPSRIYRAEAKEWEVLGMCPEPDFGLQYRSLIESYRLAPEISARQLEQILKQFFARRRAVRGQEPKTKAKGGDAE